MAIWRSPGLEALIGGPVDSEALTASAIERLVAERTPESDQLDFKRAMYGSTKGPRPSWADEQEFAKDVSAFANHRGGLLVVGVDDAGGVASGTSPLAATLSPEAEERRLRQALLNFQAPVATCDFVWVPTAVGEWFLAVVVPPSVRQPHAVLGDRGDPRPALRYPVRHGADTRFLTEAEIAERYWRRLRESEEERARAERVVSEGCAVLRRGVGLWLYVAVVPQSVVPDRLDRATVQRIETWHRRWHLNSPLERSLSAYGRAIPAPGRVTFSGAITSSADDEAQISDAYLELHVDGAAFAATQVGVRNSGDPSDRDVGVLTFVDETILLVDVGLRWAAEQAGAWGVARVVIGLTDADSTDGKVAEPVQLVRSVYQEVRRCPGTRPVDGRPTAETVADLGAVDTVQRRLAVSYQAASGLLQWFGLAEPDQLKPDGTIVLAGYSGSRARQAFRWAKDHTVETEPDKEP